MQLRIGGEEQHAGANQFGREADRNNHAAVEPIGDQPGQQYQQQRWQELCQPDQPDAGAGMGTCVKPFANGAECDGFDECESFYCQDQDPEDLCLPAYVCF